MSTTDKVVRQKVVYITKGIEGANEEGFMAFHKPFFFCFELSIKDII